MSSGQSSIDSTLIENRVFNPPPELSREAHIQSMEQYQKMYRRSMDDPEVFWAMWRRS